MGVLHPWEEKVMGPATWLSVFFILVIAAVLFWDAWATATSGRVESVSTVVRGWADNNPILPFVVGVVVGHVFW